MKCARPSLAPLHAQRERGSSCARLASLLQCLGEGTVYIQLLYVLCILSRALYIQCPPPRHLTYIWQYLSIISMDYTVILTTA